MNLDFLTYLRGILVFMSIAVIVSVLSSFTSKYYNIFECYGVVMMLVGIKTGMDIYYSDNNSDL